MRKGELTRERLIAEATRLVQAHGIGATSVNDLLLAAGVTKGSLYFHFPGKDDLCLAVLEQARERFLDFLDGNLTGATPRDQLAHMLAAVLDRHRERGFRGGCLFGNTALEMSDHDERYAREVRMLFDRWTEKVAAVIGAGQVAGTVRADLPAADLARLIVATIEGGIMLSRVGQDARPLKNSLEVVMHLLDERPAVSPSR